MTDDTIPSNRANPSLWELLEGLSEIYHPEGVLIWLRGKHKLLGGRRPAEVWDEDPEAVMALIQQMQTGAFV